MVLAISVEEVCPVHMGINAGFPTAGGVLSRVDPLGMVQGYVTLSEMVYAVHMVKDANFRITALPM